MLAHVKVQKSDGDRDRKSTYMKKTIPLLGCLAIAVSYHCHCAQDSFYVVPGGTQLLGMDLLTALLLDIRNASFGSSAEPSCCKLH